MKAPEERILSSVRAAKRREARASGREASVNGLQAGLHPGHPVPLNLTLGCQRGALCQPVSKGVRAQDRPPDFPLFSVSLLLLINLILEVKVIHHGNFKW